MKNVYDTAIIGAGASGLIAAITAARTGSDLIVLEHMDQAAKKILSTGNGKCNYTNKNQELEHYYCEDPEFLRKVFLQFSYEDTISFFEQLGIRPTEKNGTCIYPESEQASSVRNVLLAEAKRLQIPIAYEVGIRKIQLRGQLFEIVTKEATVYSRTCILATGGKAAKKTGSDGSGYLYARQFGHTIVEPLPALVALIADFKKWKLPAGVRIRCRAILYVDREQKAEEYGELQITDYGLSGIVVFQFSRIAARALAERKQVQVALDLKPDMNLHKLKEYLRERLFSKYHVNQTISGGLVGFMPDKLIPVILNRSGIHIGQLCKDCSKRQIEKLSQLLKCYEVMITGTKNFDAAQTTAGGVPISEIHPSTMESRLVKGLYFAGELVDVDAKCGGYNLQWAWSSGYTAGKNAVKLFGKGRK